MSNEDMISKRLILSVGKFDRALNLIKWLWRVYLYQWQYCDLCLIR